MTLELQILDAAVTAFNAKGVKFTMDDIAKALGISKKTIYTVYTDKESLLMDLVEQGFRRIKGDEERILNDPALSTLEKIQKIIIVMPDALKNTDFSRFKEIKEKYPKIFRRIENHIESEWEPTLSLLEQGMSEGVIRPVPLYILKAMIEASIERFLEGAELSEAGLDYNAALEAMMDILIFGIKREG